MPRSYPALLVAALAIAPACATHGDESIIITKNVASLTGCAFTSSTDEPGFPAGEISVFSGGGYQFHPQLESRIISDITVPGADLQHTIIVEGADVDLTFADPTLGQGTGGGFSASDIQMFHDSGLTHFEAPFSVNLAPNEGISDASFELVSRGLLDKITAAVPAAVKIPRTVTFETTLLATITVFGDMSGDHVTSQPFSYPVTVCNDCVVNIASGVCPLPMGTVSNIGNGCNAFQDGVLDCCLDGTGTLVCPAPVATM
jgi:hypothetical protein